MDSTEPVLHLALALGVGLDTSQDNERCTSSELLKTLSRQELAWCPLEMAALGVTGWHKVRADSLDVSIHHAGTTPR